jgi:cell division protein FtsA
MVAKEFIVAIELGSSKVTGIAGQKNLDGSITVLAVVKEPSSTFIRKGVVYNIDKTAQCLQSIKNKLEKQLNTRITQVYVGVGGQSVRGVRNVVAKDLPAGAIVTDAMIDELIYANQEVKHQYPDQEILDTSTQEYKVDTQLQYDPVGIQCSRLEGNYLNILQRKSFYKNFNKCFEVANITIAEILNAPRALAEIVLTEAERRSGCVLIDLGADTTTVSVYSKNILRHLAVIPLGGENITKDIATLQMEESDAEKMKLKYASAFTDNNEIDNTLKYPIDQDRQVESRRFIEIVEGRLEEIVENAWYQVPSEYCQSLLGGIILTGGGANMKNIEQAFRNHTQIEKIRIAKYPTIPINGGSDDIKAKNGMMNTVLGLLAKGDYNCAGGSLTGNDLFEQPRSGAETADQRPARKAGEVSEGVVLSEAEKQKAAEEARKKAEDEAAKKAAEEAAKKAEEERIRKENSKWNKFKKGIMNFGKKLVEDE